MTLDGAELAKFLGVGAAVALVLAACAVAAVKTLRTDSRIETLVDTMQQALDAKDAQLENVDRERDYWKTQAEQDRVDMERRFERRLAAQKETDAVERAHLRGQVEELRAQLHAYTLRGQQP